MLNAFRTTVLLAALTSIFMAVGYLIGGTSGMMVAFAVAVVTNVFGYWNSDKLVFVSGDRVTRGWQPTLDNYKRNYNSRAMMGTLTFSDLEINILSKDAAVVLGSWSLAREKDNPHGKFTLTFRKFKEGWRIIMDHTS